MKSSLKHWRTGLLPSLSITGLVILARLLGILQPLEWKTLDLGLRWQQPEATDPRITIVAITEEDIQNEIDYPISDADLAALVETIQTYNPRTIGIDIFRDTPIGAGYPALEKALQASNVIGVTKIHGVPVQPPPMLPEEQIGFADANLDSDGFIRRSLLADEDDFGDYRFSITTRLAEQYLAPEGVILENGIRDPETMRFGDTEIPRFQRNLGGYIRTDNGGNQALINFRAGPNPFEQISYKALMEGQVDPALINNRAVLVGYTAESVKDFVSSSAIDSDSPSLIPGVHLQAHALSQILSAYYDGRPFISALPNAIEYLLIVGSGLLGMALYRWRSRPNLQLLIFVLLLTAQLLMGYIFLTLSWWLPIIPTVAAFLLNAVLYPAYQTRAKLRSQVEERQQLIDWTFNTIHNGPLQTLSKMLSTWPQGEPAPATSRADLQQLNQELRGIYDAMQKEMLQPNKQIVMTRGTVDLDKPLTELLQDVYGVTIERNRDFFKGILKITSFKPIDATLTPQKKRDLCRVLEEMITNVYRHAKQPTRMTIDCLCENSENIIRVIDNGQPSPNPEPPNPELTVREGFGTKQAKKLARSLNGTFSRTALQPNGTQCELRWPASAKLP
ncbi:MAG: CHASE2 domain-containing protein [Cyanobacteria bacterium J06560_2]